MIHGQYLRADQIPELKELGIFPALFPMHTFYWGDWHREAVVGPERAEYISPTGWLLEDGHEVQHPPRCAGDFPQLDARARQRGQSHHAHRPRARPERSGSSRSWRSRP